MNDLSLILQEYTRLRQNGLAVREAIQALNPYVHSLSETEVTGLENEIRAWEKDRTTKVDITQQGSVVIETAKLPQDAKVLCPVCSALNEITEVTCSACGQPLDMFEDKTSTTKLKISDANTYFDRHSTIILEAINGARVHIRPQDFPGGIVIGRDVPSSTSRPDVDLSPLGAAAHGVSRLHLSMMYSDVDVAIRIHDLGSANGTYLNGHRLHHSEHLILSHGSTLQLGMLELQVRYTHPR